MGEEHRQTSRGPPLFVIAGPDGAGKTVIARGIAAHLRARGTRTRIAWMRSPRFFTYAILSYLRLTGLARGVRLGDHDDVHTDLSAHRFLAQLHAWTVTFDYFLGYAAKVGVHRRLLRRTVICDRFVWDALVDLGLASGLGERFLETPPGRILLEFGRRHPGVLLTAGREVLVERRPILGLDPRLGERLRLYARLAATFGLGVVDTGRTSEAETLAAVLAHFRLGGETPRA